MYNTAPVVLYVVLRVSTSRGDRDGGKMVANRMVIGGGIIVPLVLIEDSVKPAL